MLLKLRQGVSSLTRNSHSTSSMSRPTRNDTRLSYYRITDGSDPTVPCKRTNASRVEAAWTSQRRFSLYLDMAPSHFKNLKKNKFFKKNLKKLEICKFLISITILLLLTLPYLAVCITAPNYSLTTFLKSQREITCKITLFNNHGKLT